MTRKTINRASDILHLFSKKLSEQIGVRSEISNQDRQARPKKRSKEGRARDKTNARTKRSRNGHRRKEMGH